MDRSCKVDRVITTYALGGADPRHDSIHEGLLARWRGADSHESMGYRSLTAWFNRRLLRQVYAEAGRSTDRGRIESDFQALTGDDDLRREEVLDSLDADGIDAEGVAKDMVSWGTMRTHLTECLDGEKDAQSGGDWEQETIRMARSFASEKVDSALSSLASKDRLAGVDHASLSVQFQLQCEDCPTRVPLSVALERGYVCEQHSGEVIEP